MLSVRVPPAELNISAFPPVLRDWVIKGLGMSSLVYATGQDPSGSGMPRGGQGGHGPRVQALEGAPAQRVGPNCKKKIRPRQISKVTSLQSAVADAGFTKRGGGRTPTPEPRRRQPCRLMRRGGGGGANSGGGGRRCKHWPPDAGDPRYATEISRATYRKEKGIVSRWSVSS